MKNILIYLVPILSFVLGMAAPILREKVKKTPNKIDDILLDIALSSVGFVDKAFKGDSPESKKQRAMDLIEEQLTKYGKTVSEKALDKVVEKAVTINKVQEYNDNEELVPVEKK